ncbi:hypothetical protein AOLI_G00171230 [Acnodon oligacanthus]
MMVNIHEAYMLKNHRNTAMILQSGFQHLTRRLKLCIILDLFPQFLDTPGLDSSCSAILGLLCRIFGLMIATLVLLVTIHADLSHFFLTRLAKPFLQALMPEILYPDVISPVPTYLIQQALLVLKSVLEHGKHRTSINKPY